MFQRDGSDPSYHKPLSAVYYCTFDRILEDKEEKTTEKTIMYFKYNRIIFNVLFTFEMIYSLICMALFLIIIYWNRKGEELVILGQDD